jgi:hypothetical protein
MADALTWWCAGFDVPERPGEVPFMASSYRYLVQLESETTANAWFTTRKAELLGAVHADVRERVQVMEPTLSPPREQAVVPDAATVANRRFMLVDAEAVMNHVHLWDVIIDSVEGDPEDLAYVDPVVARRNFDETFAIARAWQRTLDAQRLGVSVGISVDNAGPYGPEVTAVRIR